MTEEINENNESATTKRTGLSLPKLLTSIIIAIVIIVAGFLLIKQIGGGVAVVNGQRITRSEYDMRYKQLAASVVAQGGSATTTEMQSAIKQQAIDNLVSETLLLQAANKEGIKADEKTINDQLTQSVKQFPDDAAYKKALVDQGFTEATYKASLTRNNIIQQYLKVHVDVSSATATDSEVKALYDQVAATNKTIPPLDQVRTEVENQIVSQKQQVLVNNFIERLKASSTVEILLK